MPTLLQSEGLDDTVDVRRPHPYGVAHQRWLAALVERLEQRDLGEGVPLRTRKLARVRLLPGHDARVADQHRGLVPGLAVGRDAEDEFGAPVAAGAVLAMAFVEILVDVPALRGVRFHASDRWRPGERRLLFREEISQHGKVQLRPKSAPELL